MNHRIAVSGAFIAPLLLSACAGFPPAVEEPDPLAAEVCHITRQRLAEAQPGTPETEALATRIESNCEALGQDYATALRTSALRGATASVADLRSPHDPGSVVRQGDKVRVTLWTNQDTVERFYSGQTGTTPPDKPVVWVTLAPEMQQWCSGLDWAGASPEERAADYQRISQRLGLPPYSLNDRFVSLWVDPERLMRPCADPGTEDNTCSATMPDTIEVPDLTREAYTAWFSNNVGYAYSAGGAPWTRYGWTYDWATDAGDPPYGVSEFMLAPSTDYKIDARHKAEDYCTM
ncbi:hypothetical protein L861_14020 [Litchfieldella anticariensis FP35 = DSM 16096]|uniref:PASTA domain-containing protein n=1 Tax=Litchfieldella anticariensis (strain DSM 16096 / CECT 5854 / CIP 108499 / LMG 22089 / FP35) TaxID=1121939 RepID=S2L6T1_LITA3|nr:hypothetical protein [Halomonas anticariensis]EPC00386.1 hypothetical protein L861_14020 [Halomonas anticariensis FP35 = DSM 16096]